MDCRSLHKKVRSGSWFLSFPDFSSTSLTWNHFAPPFSFQCPQTASRRQDWVSSQTGGFFQSILGMKRLLFSVFHVNLFFRWETHKGRKRLLLEGWAGTWRRSCWPIGGGRLSRSQTGRGEEHEISGNYLGQTSENFTSLACFVPACSPQALCESTNHPWEQADRLL